MALIEFQADLSRVATALERIATSLEIGIGPLPIRSYGKPAGPENLIVLRDEELWREEQEQIRLKEQGVALEQP